MSEDIRVIPRLYDNDTVAFLANDQTITNYKGQVLCSSSQSEGPEIIEFHTATDFLNQGDLDYQLFIGDLGLVKLIGTEVIAQRIKYNKAKGIYLANSASQMRDLGLKRLHKLMGPYNISFVLDDESAASRLSEILLRHKGYQISTNIESSPPVKTV